MDHLIYLVEIGFSVILPHDYLSKSLLTVRNTTLLYEMFSLLDAHNLGELNDSQFGSFLRSTTPLKGDHIDTIFQMLDRQGHGGITWENFYLVVAILISLKEGFFNPTSDLSKRQSANPR